MARAAGARVGDRPGLIYERSWMTEPSPTRTSLGSSSPAASTSVGGVGLHNTDRSDVSELVSLLEKQRDIYLQLQSLSGDQAGLIAGGSAEALLGLLADRQKRVDELTRINVDLEPYRSRWDEVWGGVV